MIRRAMGFVVAALFTAALGFGSRAPYTVRESDRAVLRASWRFRGEKLEHCRDRTQAELDALPVHMRTPRICTTHLYSYRLKVRIDHNRGETIDILPAGAKGDRPIFVLHDVELTPGRHEVEIEFEPITPAGTEAEHKELDFEGVVTVRRGEIALITMSDDASRLILVQ